MFPQSTIVKISLAMRALQGRDLYAEKWADFVMKIIVIIVGIENETESLI